MQQQVLNATAQVGNEVLFGILVERFCNLQFRLNGFQKGSFHLFNYQISNLTNELSLLLSNELECDVDI